MIASESFSLPRFSGNQDRQSFEHKFGRRGKIEATVGNHEWPDVGDEPGIAKLIL
jgi:hypothetical protein